MPDPPSPLWKRELGIREREASRLLPRAAAVPPQVQAHARRREWLEGCRELRQQRLRLLRLDLVLHRHMRLVLLPVLGSEPRLPPLGETLAQRGHFRGRERVGDAPPEGAQARNFEREGPLRQSLSFDIPRDGIEMFAGQLVEQREMRRDEISPGRKEAPPLCLEKGEGALVEGERQNERCDLMHEKKTRLGAGLFPIRSSAPP